MEGEMDASAYAFAHGVRHTRETLHKRERLAGGVVGLWLAGCAVAAGGLLGAVWVVASLATGYSRFLDLQPPFAVGDIGDVLHVLRSNLLVLALHGMACVAGFIAGSSLPLQAEHHSGLSRWLHEHGGRIAIAFVVAATTFSLSAQAYLIGHTLARISDFLQGSPAVFLLWGLPPAGAGLLPPFPPPCAWLISSAQGGRGAL